jgi:hypothetical protein
VVLPEPSKPQVLILLVGFSHQSGEVCAAWSKRMATDFAQNPRVAYFQLPVLQEAPTLVRPDDAYLLVADAQGRVFWQTHGSFTDSAYAEIRLYLSREIADFHLPCGGP